ncbi:LuxR C-terminal-related transcriptional regulator [Phytobacter sp. V91]|uniref:LuxR C-terminal-related transcriptional regulator n=1 Tax=Phytobacter sp. V91 TaxID=3369425 RepID=UPI003F611384
MAFLSPADHLPTENLTEEPFRFTRKLPLILTKLTPPRTPGALLQRDRLLTLLDTATSGSLALVRAAAGFGKTTLLAQWYRHRQQQGDALAWLSLEEHDSDPELFMRYLLAALRPFCTELCETYTRSPERSRSEDFSLFLVELTNALHLSPHPVYLILDDYHTLRDPEIHAGISWLLHHAPASLRLIIGSRTQPPLALGRLQIQEQYLEIDDKQLRFTESEAQAYFAQSATATVKKQDIPQLMALTEGWVAGMKIASLAPASREAGPRLAGDLRAGSRSIARYLDEVIVAPLPPAVLQFLMLTSVLNRLHPDLCDAVTNESNGKAMLAWVGQHNLFLSALDEGGFWFRYHPLMRDALWQRLQHHENVDIRLLHERAGNWFAAQQLWAEAIRHALAAGKSVTRHAEAGAQSLAEEGDIDTMVRWIRYLPATPDPSRTELQLNLAWALAHHFRFHDARQLLDAIDAMVAVQPTRLAHSTWVKQRVVRAICEAFADNIIGSIAIVEPLLGEVPCGDDWVDGLVCNILSYCHLALRRPQQALDVQQRFPAILAKNRNMFIEVYRAFVLALGVLRQGNLHEAQRLATQALHSAEQQTGTHTSSGATLAPLLAAIAQAQGDSGRACALLTPRTGMIDDFCPPDGLSLCYQVLAQQAQQNGQYDDAQQLLIHAGQLALQRGWRRARITLLAERVTLSLDAGASLKARQLFSELQQLAGAESWHTVSCESRLLLANGKPKMAATRLEAVIAEHESCGEYLPALNSRLLQAVALWQAGEAMKAAAACKPALAHAVEQHLRQSLLDAGPSLQALLAFMRSQYSGDEPLIRAIAGAESLLGVSSPPASAPLRLTEREQQTLRLIAEGNSNKSIARTLGISVETVKWHLKQLYEKLEVGGRIQAVNQARKWGWLN